MFYYNLNIQGKERIMKVAFYLDNKSHNDVDYSNPESGNPRMGGSQYMFWIIK